MSQFKRHNRGYHRTPESLKEELATGWGLIDGLLVGLTIGFILTALLYRYAIGS